jgi:hypothetical protein
LKEEGVSILSKLASQAGRRDEGPNETLAKELVENNDADGIKLIVENLQNEDKSIQGDCASVLE